MRDPSDPNASRGEITLDAAPPSSEALGPAGSERDLGRGATLGRYVVLGEIGRGAMGVVYMAYDPQLDRKVALKLLHTTSGEREARLLREAQALARLSHPNVITVHDVGTFADQVFVAMEHVDGRTLGEWLSAERPAWKQQLPVYLEAGRGLAAAHAAGLIHRDFKPDNVLLGNDGTVRVMDFGLARGAAEGDEPSGDALTSSSALEAELTQTGAVLGTPRYMAPEAHRGGPIDARSDQFSFCVALYEGLFGQRAFDGDTVPRLAFNVLQGNVKEPPRDTSVPGWLRRIVLRGLSARAGDRYDSMESLLRELGRDPAATTKRWLLAVAGLTALGTTAAVVGMGVKSPSAAEGPVCEGAADKLVNVWDAQRRQQVESAFLATGRPYAQDASRRSTEILDAYSKRWVEMYSDACEATHVRGEQSEELLDLRMQCLDNRLQQLAALSDLFATPDTRVVLESVRATHALAPIERCGDAESLRARVPPPDDALVRDRVQATRAALTRQMAVAQAGRLQESIEGLRETATEAGRIGYRPLEAESLHQLGKALSKTDAKEAEEALHRAAWAAQAGGDDEILAAAQILLLHVIGYKLARYDEGERWGNFAQASIERMGGDVRLEAHLSAERGTLAFARGDLDRARELLERGLELRTRLPSPDELQVAATMNNLGSVLKQDGKTLEAIDLYREALKMLERALGKEHPDIAVALNNLGAVLRDAQQLDAAEEAYARALAIHARSSGEGSRSVGLVLSNMGDLLTQRGRHDEAIEHHRRALTIFENVHGADHPYVGAAHLNIGHSLRRKGALDEATAEYDQALSLFEAALGPRHPFVAEVLTGQGQVLLDRGQPRPAIAPLERALGIREPGGATAREQAETRFALARALTGQRTAGSRAHELASSAREAYEEVGGDVEAVAAIDAWLAAHAP